MVSVMPPWACMVSHSARMSDRLSELADDATARLEPAVRSLAAATAG